jgi:hypothetical protein
MKHSLMSNSCPACGKELFSGHDMNIISMIQGRLGSQSFAFNFTKEILYDVSIYIFNEIKYGIGKETSADESLISSNKQVSDTVNENYDHQSGDISNNTPDNASDNTMVDIRKEVENELQEEIDEITEGQEDIFSKAERLKRLAQQRRTDVNPQQDRQKISATKKTGASVKRSI